MSWRRRYFYERRPAPQAKAGSYRRKYGTSWWGKQFLLALEAMDYSGRLGRGKTYANKGLVENLHEARPGHLTATVQGSRPQPYEVELYWSPWSEAQSEALLEAISQQPVLIGKLMAGSVPNQLVRLIESLGMEVFPKSFQDFKVDCSCPDWAIPCKHMAATFYVLTGRIDSEPFYLFKLRGLDLEAWLATQSDQPIADPTRIQSLMDYIQPVSEQPSFQWDEAAYQALDLGIIGDHGRRAVALLPEQPAFDDSNSMQSLLKKLYDRSSRYAQKLYLKALDEDHPRLLDPNGTLEIHLDAGLALSFVAYFDEEDEELLTIEKEADILHWLTQLELLERHTLDSLTRSMLLAFQLARQLVARQAYVPRLLHVSEGRYLMQYRPVRTDESLNALLEESYQLVAAVLPIYRLRQNEPYEFKPTDFIFAEQLVAALIGTMIRQATMAVAVTTPVEKLFALRGMQQFELVGTEQYPSAIQRWLDRLEFSRQRWQPVFQVTEEEELLAVDLLVTDLEADDNQVPCPLAQWLAEGQHQTGGMGLFRTLAALSEHFPEVDDYLLAGATRPMRFSVAQFAPVLRTILPNMEALGLRVALPAALKKLLRPNLGLRAETQGGDKLPSGIISLDGLLRFNWLLAIGDQEVAEEDFRKLFERTSGLVRFQSGYAFLDPKEIQRLLEKLDAGPPELKVHERMQALFTEEYQGGPVELSPDLRALLDQWRSAPPPALPDGLLATLRPYQQRGYDWMYANARFGFGSIIADDMGLGKTLQVITLLLKYKEEGALDDAQSLVVVPTSLLRNWQQEIERFAPDLRAAIYHGSERVFPETDSFDVLITTYGLIRSEEKTWQKGKWAAVIIDEAQQIKNPQTKQAKLIKKIKAPVRIAMSGTPVENSLTDYWSLLDFTLPKFLGSRTYFNQHFSRPIQQERDQAVIRRFRKLTAPFVLRRLKTDKSIIADLPDKIIQTEYCTLTPEQAALYQSIISENLRAVESANDTITRQGLILKLITALKQCCNHPAHFLKQSQAPVVASGKTRLLHSRLSEILSNGDKALIFTQYREMGELLVQLIQQEFGVAVPYLHGGTPSKKRAEMVDRFQKSADCPLFLLSIKAGGTGLNLTAANHVIHYDLWWNPAVENQATDRAYRIGQDRTVFVHRLVTEKTFEEKIDQLIQSKQELADLSVGSGETWVGKLSNRELEDLVSLS